MISAGLEAILIKVAGVGLTARHLGQNLAQMQSTLLSLVNNIVKLRAGSNKKCTHRMTVMVHMSVAKVENMKPLLSIPLFSSDGSECESCFLQRDTQSHLSVELRRKP